MGESATAATSVAGNIAAAWSVYDGHQPNDPAALGEALVQIADMEHPPRVFAAGSDALDAITPVVEARLAELRAHADLSKAAGGAFEEMEAPMR